MDDIKVNAITEFVFDRLDERPTRRRGVDFMVYDRSSDRPPKEDHFRIYFRRGWLTENEIVSMGYDLISIDLEVDWSFCVIYDGEDDRGLDQKGYKRVELKPSPREKHTGKRTTHESQSHHDAFSNTNLVQRRNRPKRGE